MLFTALLLIISGILCLIGTVISLVFGVISLANNKTNKYIWLSSFLCFLIGMIFCIFMFVKAAVDKVTSFTENTFNQFDNYSDSLKNYDADIHVLNHNGAQAKLLKSYVPTNMLNNVPEQFYSYAGFKDYYRYPLRYPFSIHCMNGKDNSELYNEINVTRFDENDNGDIYSGLTNINKIAFDKTYLLVEQTVPSTRSENTTNHFVLFNFDTEKREEAPSLSKLLQLAKEKGYTGRDTLITMVKYHSLF